MKSTSIDIAKSASETIKYFNQLIVFNETNLDILEEVAESPQAELELYDKYTELVKILNSSAELMKPRTFFVDYLAITDEYIKHTEDKVTALRELKKQVANITKNTLPSLKKSLNNNTKKRH